MIKTLAKQIKEFKAASIATPLFMILEVLMEMIIPYLMASIIDKGVNTGDIHHIYKVGGIMVVAAVIGLFAGMMGGRFGAKASAGFARNLREAMFNNIQTFSFSNIDNQHSGTCNPNDNGCNQYTECISDDPAYVHQSTGQYDLCDGHGIYDQCETGMYLSCSGNYSWNFIVPDHEHATKYFQQAFPKYDDLNESVQENVSAIRVVKAYVREEQETSKLRRASENIYNIL